MLSSGTSKTSSSLQGTFGCNLAACWGDSSVNAGDTSPHALTTDFHHASPYLPTPTQYQAQQQPHSIHEDQQHQQQPWYSRQYSTAVSNPVSDVSVFVHSSAGLDIVSTPVNGPHNEVRIFPDKFVIFRNLGVIPLNPLPCTLTPLILDFFFFVLPDFAQTPIPNPLNPGVYLSGSSECESRLGCNCVQGSHYGFRFRHRCRWAAFLAWRPYFRLWTRMSSEGCAAAVNRIHGLLQSLATTSCSPNTSHSLHISPS